MKNSSLLEVWTTLSDEDKKQIRRAVHSPFFNQRKEITALLEYLEKQQVSFSAARRKTGRTNQQAEMLSKTSAFKVIYSSDYQKRGYNDLKMRQLMSALLEIIRQVLAVNYLKSVPFQIELNALKWLKAQGYEQLFEKNISKIKVKTGRLPQQGEDFFLNQFLLEQENWEHIRQRQRTGQEYLLAMNTSFSAYVAINTLRQACSVKSQQSVAATTVRINYLQETLQLVQSGNFSDIPAVDAWHAAYQALTSADATFFFRLKQYITAQSALFPPNDLRDLYVLAINVCIKKINTSNKDFFQQAFELYKSGLQLGLFLENGHLSKFTYRNVLNVAAALEEWDWAFQYLSEFKSFLPPKDQENTFTYNLATFYFRKKEYGTAQTLLARTELKDHLENFDSRRMLLRIYYETGEWQALQSLADSFEVYLRRNKSGGYHREMYLNFVRLLKRILALLPSDIKAKDKLLQEIIQCEYLAEREWLTGITQRIR